MLQRKYNFQHFYRKYVRNLSASGVNRCATSIFDKKILCFHNRTIYYKFKVDLEEIRNETLNNKSLHTITVLAFPAIGTADGTVDISTGTAGIAGVSSPPVSSISDVNNIKNMSGTVNSTINDSNASDIEDAFASEMVKHDDKFSKYKSNDNSSGYVIQIEGQ